MAIFLMRCSWIPRIPTTTSGSIRTTISTWSILGGEDHKTGQEPDTAARFQRLQEALIRAVPAVEVTHRWSGQVIETPDGLPYIGTIADRQFIATGFAGNGMTFGTVAAMMARDAVLGVRNPWTDLFDPARTKLSAGGVWDYLTENKDYPYYLIRDRFAGAGRKVAARGEARRGPDSRSRRRARRGLPCARRIGHGSVCRLHPPGVHRPVESGGADVGLPVSRLAIRPGRERDRGSC